jgi:hypothetical protein
VPNYEPSSSNREICSVVHQLRNKKVYETRILIIVICFSLKRSIFNKWNNCNFVFSFWRLYCAHFIILYNEPTNAQLIDKLLYCCYMFRHYIITLLDTHSESEHTRPTQRQHQHTDCILYIIIIIIISFMQGIYTYILQANNVPRKYIVAAILLLLFMVPITLVPALALLCFYVSTFRSLLLLLLSSSSSSSSSSLFPRQTMSLGNTVMQLFCCYYLWCLYR